MSAWVFTLSLHDALPIFRSLSVVVVEALAVLDRSVVRPESTLTTRLTLGAPPAVIVPRDRKSTRLNSSYRWPPYAVYYLMQDGIGSLRTTPRASDGPPLW